MKTKDRHNKMDITNNINENLNFIHVSSIPNQEVQKNFGIIFFFLKKLIQSFTLVIVQLLKKIS